MAKSKEERMAAIDAEIKAFESDNEDKVFTSHIESLKRLKTELEGKVKTRIAAVVFLIHIRTPNQYIAKLFVTGVPSTVQESSLKSLITRSGRSYSEFGVPWANHYIENNLDNAEDEVVGAYNAGETETVSFEELRQQAEI